EQSASLGGVRQRQGLQSLQLGLGIQQWGVHGEGFLGTQTGKNATLQEVYVRKRAPGNAPARSPNFLFPLSALGTRARSERVVAPREADAGRKKKTSVPASRDDNRSATRSCGSKERHQEVQTISPLLLTQSCV